MFEFLFGVFVGIFIAQEVDSIPKLNRFLSNYYLKTIKNNKSQYLSSSIHINVFTTNMYGSL